MASYAVGSDGSVTFPTGFNAVLNTWSATIGRTTQVLTGYGANVHNRRASAVVDITGSAGGIPKYWDGDTGSDNSQSPISHTDSVTSNLADAGDLTDQAGGNITLTVATGCTLTFGAVFSSYALTVTNDGDSAITFNFEMNDGDGPTAVWDETA